MDGRLERKVSQSSEANIDQTESWMIDGDAAAALCAITAVADVAALEFSQELRAFGEVHILPFPQRECAGRKRIRKTGKQEKIGIRMLWAFL